MKKKKALLGLFFSIIMLISVSFTSIQATSNVAWGVHRLTHSEAAAGVTGTGVAIGAGKAIAIAIRGASWGARLGAYAGPIGIAGGAIVGGL